MEYRTRERKSKDERKEKAVFGKDKECEKKGKF
jgi:hypothetical protein